MAEASSLTRPRRRRKITSLLARLRRVPVRLQLNAVECGAACLAMVLSYFGRHTTVGQLREECASGRGGVSAATIAAVARSYGLTARGLRAVPQVLDRIIPPAIAHWRGNHFVVVERWSPRWVDIVDPEWGRRRLSRREFEETVGEAILVFEPGPAFRRARRTEASTLRTLIGLAIELPGFRGSIGQIIAATGLLQLLGLALPIATMLVVDHVLGIRQTELIPLVGAGLLITVAAQVVAGYLRAVLLIHLQGRFDWQVINRFAEHLFRLPLRFFHQRTSGDIMTRLSSIVTLRDLLANQTVAAILDAALLLTYVGLMFVFDVVLASMVVVALLAHVGVFALVARRARDLMALNVAAQIGLNQYLVQSLAGVSTIKATGAEHNIVHGVSDRIFDWTGATLRRSHLTAALETFGSGLRLLTPLLVLWLGAVRVLDGHLTPGALLAFLWLVAAVLGPVSGLLLNWQRLQTAGLQVERLSDVLDAAPERTGTAPLPPRRRLGAAIELENVSFSYEVGAPPAVHQVSLAIEPGQRVAIVGRTGAGKTTLAWLMMGLYEPQHGEIRYDGVPIRETDPRQLRRRFGVVLQDQFTIRASIRDNIAFSHPAAAPEDVLWAARIAEVDAEVSQLPMGYETPLAERGVGLSGGQLQRLALARALVGRPSVLVLDEATSHLDGQTERRIVDNLQGVDCTQIIIAHRLSTVRNADLIVVLDQGRMIEAGSHEDLLARGGPYAMLVAAQLGAGPPSQSPAAQCPPAVDGLAHMLPEGS